MLSIKNNRLYFKESPFIIVEAGSPETRLKQCSKAEQDYLSSIGVNTLYCTCNGKESSGAVNPWINNDINQGYDTVKVSQWLAYLQNWVFGYPGKTNIVHLLLSEKETHDTFTEVQHKLLIDQLTEAFTTLQGYIIWDREEVPNNWSKATSLYSYLKQVDPLNIRGMHNNTNQNPWAFSYNSDLVQFLSFQENVSAFDNRIKTEVAKNSWAGYASEMTGGFQPTDTTKAETLFKAGGNLNSGVGVYIASKDQTIPDFHQQYEQVYKKLVELSTGVITPPNPQPTTMIIGISLNSDRSDFKPIPATITPGAYYVEARQCTAPVVFTLKKEGVTVLTKTENGAPYDLNGGTAYAFVNGNYSLEVKDKTGSLPAINFTVGTTTTPVRGCTNPLATNYNPLATEDDGSCILPPTDKPEVTVNVDFNPSEVTMIIKLNGVIKP